MIPAVNTVMEHEFHKMAPEGISIHATRMGKRRNWTELSILDGLIKMAEETEDAADKLATAQVGVLVYGCTAGSFVKGIEWEKDLVRRIKQVVPEIPAITTTGAVLSALKESGIKKLAVGTPYPEDANVKLRELLKEAGFDVISFKGLRLDPFGVQAQTPETSYKLGKEVYRPEADGIFISCTTFRTIEIIERLERETGKPVVTSNQASMWAALKKIGFEEPIKGYGKLLEKL